MRPRHDAPPQRRGPKPGRAFVAAVLARVRRPRPPGSQGGEGEPVPVRPDRPLDLSGGAAAPLEFDS